MILEKILERVKILVVIALIILVSLVAFWGVFWKDKGVWKNAVPDYQYGMELEGTRELRYGLDTSEEEKYVYVDENGNIKGEVWKDGNPTTEEAETNPDETADAEASKETADEEIPYKKETRTIKVNSDDKLTKENFETAKKIIQKRFKEQEIREANLRIDDVTGNLMIETANNDQVELVEDLVSSVGKLQIIDYQNGLVLMDNADIKNVSVVSSNNEATYNTYLQLEFNKEGAEKLREISTQYVEIKNETETQNEETTEETEEEHNHDEETEKKYVSIVFDNTTIMTTYFGEEMTAGMLQIPVGQARTTQKEFLEDYESAQNIANILKLGMMPVTYRLETDNFVKSQYTADDWNALKIVAATAIALASVILMIKFKKNGILAALLAIGYIAVLSIVMRYTNVILTQNSLATFWLVIIFNYIFMKLLLKQLQTQEITQAYSQTAKKFYLGAFPVAVFALVFTFSKYVTMSSVGMVLFWGIMVHVVYHALLTRAILKKQN